MDKNCKRAIRRHHYQRLKVKRRYYYGDFWYDRLRDLSERDRARILGMRVATMPSCSCCLCGNPRRHYGELTIQERRLAGWEQEIDWERGDYREHDD